MLLRKEKGTSEVNIIFGTDNRDVVTNKNKKIVFITQYSSSIEFKNDFSLLILYDYHKKQKQFEYTSRPDSVCNFEFKNDSVRLKKKKKNQPKITCKYYLYFIYKSMYLFRVQIYRV